MPTEGGSYYLQGKKPKESWGTTSLGAGRRNLGEEGPLAKDISGEKTFGENDRSRPGQSGNPGTRRKIKKGGQQPWAAYIRGQGKSVAGGTRFPALQEKIREPTSRVQEGMLGGTSKRTRWFGKRGSRSKSKDLPKSLAKLNPAFTLL